MKKLDYEFLLRGLNQDLNKSTQPLNATDTVIYLRAIVEGLCHISKQIEELQSAK